MTLLTDTGELEATERAALFAITRRPETIATRTVSRRPGLAPLHTSENPLRWPWA